MTTSPISEIGVLPLFLYSLANLVVVCGYLLLAFWIVRSVPIPRYARIALRTFYLCGAFVHAALGIGNVFTIAPNYDASAWWLVAVFHTVQAASVGVALASYYIVAGSRSHRQIVIPGDPDDVSSQDGAPPRTG